jgi:hypothetical protein
VDGTIEERPFTTYHYPSKDGEREVVAYLLRADTPAEGEPSGPARAPTWVSAEQACERLRSRREERYATELVRVLDETLPRIPPTPPKPG